MTAVATPSKPERGPAPVLAGELRQIPLVELVESPWNPRKHLDPAKLAEMADSLRKGQLAPIIVRPASLAVQGRKACAHDEPCYEIGAGHRRYRAAPAAGLTSLLAIVREMDDVTFLELLTIENKQRDDVTPLDEANGFKLLMEKAGYDVAKLAARIGLSTKYVYDRLKLLQLSPAAKKLLEDGTITAGHAILIARLSPTDQARAVGKRDNDSWNGVRGGLFEVEDSEGFDFEDDEHLKPRSVRELQGWIHDNVRMKPETVDGFLFPETAEVLTQAKADDDKVVHITHDYRVPDGARDEKTRTFGEQSWKRADGRKGSKKCELSVIGLVVAGPDQGEAFRVCVNKHRCKIHWKTEATAYEKKQKEAKAAAKRARSADEDEDKPPTEAELRREQENLRQTELDEMRTDFFDVVLASHKAEFLAGAAKRAAPFKQVPADSLMAMLDDEFYIRSGAECAEQIQQLVRADLPGKWARGWFGPNSAKDAAAARSYIGLALFLALDVEKLDAQLDREIEAAAEKALKAEAAEAKELEEKKSAKKPAPKKAKKGGR